ncbi:Aliphatic sulfonates import ATP-binding protein SsuB [Usitatibacter rugosus]|uniref:Aliphatic sulfonates import ATP-binding protein SsuB n=1 Tax=Usitatibacter rugosus TaxID=2732067 RepID=A0A6M4GYQ0_9PROT|nr:ATP-binding cassette domain-containing protein [Usitatibacter rugosus]QJR11634.1 Aliphatic sulfonates import ATP-binding protein SsuB [Usitatibacter rugosus]
MNASLAWKAPPVPFAAKLAAPRSATGSTNGIALHVEGLDKSYGTRQVLRGLSLAIEPGAFVAIVGRSGCGKSTLLRAIAGLENAERGTIAFDGRERNGLHPDARIMYQEPRLLPWKRVIDNVALGLERGAREDARRVLAQVGLADRADEWPAVLSGGQRQRVALARALVHRPRLLLLDEPLGALDALTRIEMQGLIESLWREAGFTAVLVTHDVGEAVALADRVVLIEDGAVTFDEDVGLPRPRTRGSAVFARLEEAVLSRVLRG